MKTSTLLLEDPAVEVTVRRSRRSKRLSLSVSTIDGAVRLSAPANASEASLRKFLALHRDWLRQRAGAAAPVITPIADGAWIPFQGRVLRIEARPGQRRLSLDEAGDVLQVGGAAEAAGRRATLWLKEQARARLVERSTHYAAALGVRFSQIAIRDTKSRWGSCSSSGALSYSWRLVLAPPAVLDYVAAHEVSHLREMNHSPRFWALVEALKPDWRADRDWLKEHGAALHRYRAP